MIDITKDIQPLTTFRNHSVEFMRQLKATQRPLSSLSTANPRPSFRTPPFISASSTLQLQPIPTKASIKA